MKNIFRILLLLLATATLQAQYRAGIKYLPMERALLVLEVEPGSPNKSLQGKFIVAIDQTRGSGAKLQNKLIELIAKHQDGSTFPITLMTSPGSSETYTTLSLYDAQRELALQREAEKLEAERAQREAEKLEAERAQREAELKVVEMQKRLSNALDTIIKLEAAQKTPHKPVIRVKVTEKYPNTPAGDRAWAAWKLKNHVSQPEAPYKVNMGDAAAQRRIYYASEKVFGHRPLSYYRALGINP